MLGIRMVETERWWTFDLLALMVKYCAIPNELKLALLLVEFSGSMQFLNTVFVLISAHAPISVHPGHFRKLCK